jgi:hypothetical protein
MSSNALDLFDLFSSDKESEEAGRWLNLTEATGFKIRAFGAKAVTDLRETLMKPFTALLKAGATIPDEKNEEIGLKVLAGAIIADWKGVKNADGVEVPYSADEAYAILKALPKLAAAVIQFSLEGQNFKDEVREESSGNS